MSDDLFDNKAPKEEGTPEGKPAEANNESTYLEMILNDEGKPKYANTEEALKGAVHAQSHIANLEKELAAIRDDATKGADMQKVLEALEKKKEGEGGEETPAAPAPIENIESVLEAYLSKRDNVQTQKDNVQTVVSTFQSLYGDKASEVLYSKANDLGFSKEEINGMVSTNPTAALKILGVDKVDKKVADPIASGSGHVVDLSGGKDQGEPASIMGSTDSKSLTDSWKQCQAATNKRLGVEIPS